MSDKIAREVMGRCLVRWAVKRHLERVVGSKKATNSLLDEVIRDIEYIINGKGKTLELENQLKAAAASIKYLEQKRAFEDRLIETMMPHISALPPCFDAKLVPFDEDKYNETQVVILSDWHIGEKIIPQDLTPSYFVSGKSEKVEMIGGYDLNVAARRVEHMADETIFLGSIHKNKANIKDLYVWGLGDMVSGDIHEELQKHQDVNVVGQASLAAFLLASYIRDVAPYYEDVYFFGVSGNHGRLSKKVEYKSAAHYNWDYVVYQLAAMMCKDIPNVHFQIPTSKAMIVQVEGKNFYIHHGDGIKSHMSIPYYGVDRAKRNVVELGQLMDVKIDSMVIAHFHTDLQAQHGALIINDSLIGANEFSVHHQYYSRPGQKIFGVHNKHTVSWSYSISFDGIESPFTPQRYKLPENPLWARWT